MTDQVTAIVVGGGKTGSSAVFDYLQGRPDVRDPLRGAEFRLSHDPDGLMALRWAAVESFTLNGASAALHRFRERSRRFGRSPRAAPPGLDYARLIPGYAEFIKEFTDEVESVSYSGASAADRSSMSTMEYAWAAGRYLARRRRQPSSSPNERWPGQMLLPVDADAFDHAATSLLDKLLGTASGKPRLTVVNQGSSFWTPVSASRHYREPRIIVVTRDPRGVYADLLSKGHSYPGDDIDTFCRFYSTVMSRRHLDQWQAPEVLHLTFEDFVLDHTTAVQGLCAHLQIDPSVRSNYAPTESAENVAHFRNVAQPSTLTAIEDSLTHYLNPRLLGI